MTGHAPEKVALLEPIESAGHTAFMALLLAIPAAFFVGCFGTIGSETVQDLIALVCDAGDQLFVRTETAGRGTGYDVYCITPRGESYGCVRVAAAEFDLAFPFTYAGILAGFWIRRRTREPRRLELG